MAWSRGKGYLSDATLDLDNSPLHRHQIPVVLVFLQHMACRTNRPTVGIHHPHRAVVDTKDSHSYERQHQDEAYEKCCRRCQRKELAAS
jgi:hypothetical protein